jgi:hypothetical protein
MMDADEPRRGLKDDEIAKVINAVRDALEPHLPRYGALRVVIRDAVMGSLIEQGLRIPGKGG